MKYLALIPLIVISIASAMLLAFRPHVPAESPIIAPMIDAGRFVDRARFTRALAQAPTDCPVARPRAAVVNHHALMSDLMARIIIPLGTCLGPNPRIIILSPDHFGKSVSPAAFHRMDYRFDTHTVSSRKDAPDLAFAKEQNVLFENEHGVGALIPFIAVSMPEATILPLIIKRSITDEELSRFADYLKEEMANGAFLLVSSDMSHYLGERQARYNDQKTLAAFFSGDSAFFAAADDDYTDNGRALAAVILALGPSSFTAIDQDKISSDVDGANTFTTTYITGFWE